MAKKSSGGTPATVALDRAGIPFTLHATSTTRARRRTEWRRPRASGDVAAAERASGYVACGVSPVGQKRLHPTVVDDSALDHPTVYVSAGRRGLDLALAPADLVATTSAVSHPALAPRIGSSWTVDDASCPW